MTNPSKTELLEARIYQFLRDYRLSNMTCEGTTDNFYPLVDAISHPAAKDISNGEGELRRIASELAGEILPDAPSPTESHHIAEVGKKVALTEALTRIEELEPTILGLQNAYRLLILTAKERGMSGYEGLYHELCNLEYNMCKLQKATGIGDIYEDAALTKGIKE